MITNENKIDDYLKRKAEKINEITNVISKNYIELGKHLYDVKVMLSHGKWGPWIEKNCTFCQKTAENIMNYYFLSLNRPELMHFKKTVIFELGAKNYPEIILEQLSLYMRGTHFDLSLSNALALRKDYINGKIDFDGRSVKEFLTKTRKNSLVYRLQVEGERVNKIIQREMKVLTKLLNIEIEIDDDVKGQDQYRKMLIEILDKASSTIAHLNETFDITKDESDNCKNREYIGIASSILQSSCLYPDVKVFNDYSIPEINRNNYKSIIFESAQTEMM